MSVKNNGKEWRADVRPNGADGNRYRKTFKTKREALEYEAWLKTNATQVKDWQPQKRDSRKLSELIEIWYAQHGINLNSGEDTYNRLKNLCKAVNNPIAEKFNGEMFAEYRAKRISDGISANNMNREKNYAQAMFNELKRLDIWTSENPLSKVRNLKIAENELSFLTLEQIDILLSELRQAQNEHVYIISQICLATGARWSEAEQLRKSQVRNGLIQFSITKSKKTRAVPIDKELEKDIHSHYENKSKNIGDERLFTYAYSAFIAALKRSEILLPKGQAAHVMRHTFASHFMINGGNIITLQKLLGHSSLTMTMRYAHLSPDHLAEARILNPLSNWRKMDK